jgi:uncharacterized protein
MIALPLLAREGLLTYDSALRALLFLPPLIIGIWLGSRSFKTADPRTFRRIVLLILAALAVVSTIQGVMNT